MTFVMQSRRWLHTACLGFALFTSLVGDAHAQQPLEEFLSAAGSEALDVREARARAAKAESQVSEARGRLLPSLNLNGAYTRNEIQAKARIPDGMGGFREAVFTPYDQLEGRATLSVPLLDLGAWRARSQADVSARAEAARAEQTLVDVRVQVAEAYVSVVASRAVRTAAQQTQGTAEDTLRSVVARHDAGIASDVDRARAERDVERAKQTVAEADLQVALSVRSLELLTGLSPSEREVSLHDDLQEETALETWLPAAQKSQAVRAAAEDQKAAERGIAGARSAYAPSVVGRAQERLTNAAGFGQNDAWSVSVTLDWTLDLTKQATLEARKHDLEVSKVRSERSLQSQETAIFDAWHRARSLTVKARAARAAEAASDTAAKSARARFEAGTSTQLELSQALRDLFSAELSRIQADAELRLARVTLRLRTDRPTRSLGAGEAP